MDSESIGSDCSSCEPAASSVCHVCQGFGDLSNPRGFIERLQTDELIRYVDVTYEYVYTYVHHPNVGALLASAEAGCDVCTVLCDSLKGDRDKNFDAIAARYYPPAQAFKQPQSVAHTTPMDNDTQEATQFAESMRQNRAFTETHLENYDNGRVVLSFSCDHESGPRACSTDQPSLIVRALTTPSLVAYSISFINSPQDDLLDPEQQHRPCRDLLSGPHIGLINRWRDTCKSEHKSCNRFGCEQPLPTRVLELSDPLDDESVCGVRLVETRGDMQGPYACLSYCWGGPEIKNQIGRTTTVNLRKQLQSISLETLPKTIIDTIYLCYRLSFRFLWIDRLCIIQDDEQDWGKEASKMCEIYSGSTLTISVPLCVESSQSFLQKRLDTHRFDEEGSFATIDFIDEISKNKGRLILISGPKCRNKASWFLEESWDEFASVCRNEENRWISRGWTFQEWMLSPRVLHIDTMTLWDCFDGYANELNRRYTEIPRLLRDQERFGGGISWDLIVKEYTYRSITYKKDKLPALAGLAARYAQTTAQRYLAGLWFEEMPYCLLWRKMPDAFEETSGDNEGEDSSQTVPSWSWASVDFSINYDMVSGREDTVASSFVADASVYRCSDHPNSVSTKEKVWIDIKGYMSVVTDQDMLGNYHELSNSRIEGGNHWWNSIPDRVLNYSREDIAQSRIHLIILGSSIPEWRHYRGSNDDGSSGDANSEDANIDDANIDDASIDDANIDGTSRGGSIGESCSIESSSDGSELDDTERIYGALVLESCGLIDNRQCFRRLGIAHLYWYKRLKVYDGPGWELQDIRLI